MKISYRMLAITSAACIALVAGLTAQGAVAAQRPLVKFQNTAEPTLAPTMQATSAAPTGTGEVLYKETFDSNSVDWETAENEKLPNNAGSVTSVIQDGVYRIRWEPKTADTDWIVAPGFNDRTQAPIFKDNYDFQVQVTKLTTKSGKYTIGVLFNEQDQYNGFDKFIIDQDGKWVASSARDPQSQETVLSRGTIPAVDFTKGTHTIGVRVEASVFHFSIDGNTIDQSVTDDSFPTGTVGLFIGGAPGEVDTSILVEFDNIVVRSTSSPSAQ